MVNLTVLSQVWISCDSLIFMALLAVITTAPSYIQNLPNGTLRDIFINYITQCFSVWQHTRASVIKPSFTLSSVCYQWCLLSLASPQLWTVIQFIKPTVHHALYLVPLLLERSKDRSLAVNIGFENPDNYATPEATQAFAALLSHSNCIDTLYIWYFLPPFFHEFKNSLHSLSQLCIGTIFSIPAGCGDALIHCTSLSAVVIECRAATRAVYATLPAVQLPPSIAHIDFMQCFDSKAICTLPSLLSITLDGIPRCIADAEIMSATVSLLEILVDYQTSPYQLQQVFTQLAFPGLKKLSIVNKDDLDNYWWTPWPQTDFSTFLQCCNLAILTIDCHLPTSDDLLAALPALGSLVCLSIIDHGDTISYDVVRALAPDCFPRLHQLKLDACSFIEMEHKEIKLMIMCFWQQQSCCIFLIGNHNLFSEGVEINAINECCLIMGDFVSTTGFDSQTLLKDTEIAKVVASSVSGVKEGVHLTKKEMIALFKCK